MTQRAEKLLPETMAEMVRQAERVVDDQVKAFERADAKSERLVGLSVALMGAGLAIAVGTVPGAARPLDFPSLAVLATASVVNGRALRRFLLASVGMLHRSGVRLGPSPDWVANRGAQEHWPLAEFQARTLQSIAGCYLENLAKLEGALQHRRGGVRDLLAASALFAAAIIHIAGR